MSAGIIGFAIGAVALGGLAALVTAVRTFELVVGAQERAERHEARRKAAERELSDLMAVSRDMRAMLEGMPDRCGVCPLQCPCPGEPYDLCALDGALDRCGVTLPPPAPRGYVSQCAEEDE